MQMCFLYMCMHLNMYIKVGPYESVLTVCGCLFTIKEFVGTESHGCIYVNCMYNLNIDAYIKEDCSHSVKCHVKQWTEFSEQLLEGVRVLLR